MLLKLIKVEKGLCIAGMVVSGALLVALVLMSGCNVAFRLAGHPVSASYELSGLFGALIAALLVGFVDTFGKVLLPQIAGMLVYMLMAAVLLWKPEGLFKQ